MILLIIDAQKLITNEKLYMFDKVVYNIEKLIHSARTNNVEVIYVVHDDGADSDLTVGKEGFEIYERFSPRDSEKIFVKTVNSAFKNTGLLEYLNTKSEKDVVITGLQTDFCIDASIKCGFEHNFNIIVPKYANSTVNNDFMTSEISYNYYNEYIWNNRYATLLSVEDTIKLFE